MQSSTCDSVARDCSLVKAHTVFKAVPCDTAEIWVGNNGTTRISAEALTRWKSADTTLAPRVKCAKQSPYIIIVTRWSDI
jgi:hypothetical protein